MAPGDVTIIGPYACNAAGVSQFDTDLTGLSSGAANEMTGIIPCANGLQFYAYWVAVA